MPEITADQALAIEEMGMVRIADGVYVMDLTGESRIPIDLHVIHKLDAILAGINKTNQYLAELTNTVVD